MITTLNTKHQYINNKIIHQQSYYSKKPSGFVARKAKIKNNYLEIK